MLEGLKALLASDRSAWNKCPSRTWGSPDVDYNLPRSHNLAPPWAAIIINNQDYVCTPDAAVRAWLCVHASRWPAKLIWIVAAPGVLSAKMHTGVLSGWGSIVYWDYWQCTATATAHTVHTNAGNVCKHLTSKICVF